MNSETVLESITLWVCNPCRFREVVLFSLYRRERELGLMQLLFQQHCQEVFVLN